MKKLKLVVFDCDGVMFDSREANLQYYNHLLEHFGRPVMDEEELEYVHMHNVIDSVNHIFRNSPDDLEKADQYRRNLDYQPFLKYMTIEPDLIEFLEFLVPEHQAAISTNRTTTMAKVLDIFKLRAYFGLVMTPMEVEHSKPHPEALHRILAHFKVEVDEAIFIGDSIIDQQHAAGVGMRLIAFKNPALDADYHVSSFTEIRQLPLFDKGEVNHEI